MWSGKTRYTIGVRNIEKPSIEQIDLGPAKMNPYFNTPSIHGQDEDSQKEEQR